MTILAALLTGVLLAGQEPPPEGALRADAIARARTGDYREALDAFRRIVSADPGDHDARVWIARLQGWMGDPGLAEGTYRSVLQENARHVDAMVGLGGILVTLGRTDEAFEVLGAAERAAPANPEVLAALARAHRLNGATTQALSYIERAVALAPTADHLRARDQIRRVHAHRIDVTGFVEDFRSTLPRARVADVSLNLRAGDGLRVAARGQAQRRFAIGEQRAGAGIEWRLGPATTVAAGFLAGPGNTVLPRTDVATDLTHVAGGIEWTGGYRYVEFASARVSVISPGVTVWPAETWSVAARYYLAVTDYASGAPLQRAHSGLLRASVATGPHVWITGGYSRGTENFETLSADRIGVFRADTASVGVRIDLPGGLSSFATAYEHQWRTGPIDMRRVAMTFIQRF